MSTSSGSLGEAEIEGAGAVVADARAGEAVRPANGGCVTGVLPQLAMTSATRTGTTDRRRSPRIDPFIALTAS
jgi:hypothetical protein